MAKSNDKQSAKSVDINENTDIFSEDAAEITNQVINNEQENSEMSEQINETDVKSEDVKSEDVKAEETEDTRDPYIPVENIPSFEGINAASAPLANSFLLQILTFRNSYLDKVEELAASSFDESRENVLAFAEKYKERNPELSALVELFVEAEKAMQAAYSNLTNAVKETANVKVLSPEDRKANEDEAKTLLTTIANAVDAMKRFEASNPMGTIQPAIEWVESIPALPAIKGKGKASTKPVVLGQGVSRPRLSGGYIKVADAGPYDSFSKAMNAIITAVGKDVKAPEVHKAWYDAAGVNSWQEVPADKEIKFEFDGVPITILRKAA